jgi:UDP-N-acetylglucosamine--N-acetylmuramyl-(pentapeptide) pyrophosphoryl-undecaprenol N-acetylglucosamine transferase
MLLGAGAAKMIEDADATPETLEPMLNEILGDPDAREGMSLAAHSVARPDAADAMASWILSLAEVRRA